MDWATVYEGLRYWFAAQSGISAEDVIWEGEPEGMRGDPCAYLKLMGHGAAPVTDELGYQSQGPAQQALVGVRGNRTMTLSCRVQSRDQTPTGRAFVILERVRNGVELPSTQQTFCELGIAALGTAALVELGRVWDKREESHAVLDLRLGTTVDTLAAATNPAQADGAQVELVNSIEHVIVTGTVAEPEPVSVPPQLIP